MFDQRLAQEASLSEQIESIFKNSNLLVSRGGVLLARSGGQMTVNPHQTIVDLLDHFWMRPNLDRHRKKLGSKTLPMHTSIKLEMETRQLRHRHQVAEGFKRRNCDRDIPHCRGREINWLRVTKN